jgi:hypothetical protein
MRHVIWAILLAVWIPAAAQADHPDEEKDKPEATKAEAPAVAEKAEPIDESEAEGEVIAGHSGHGGAFNEGPRQAAYLMGGTGKVSFPLTTTSEEARAFFLQGLGQLHGFWYFESERSFA